MQNEAEDKLQWKGMETPQSNCELYLKDELIELSKTEEQGTILYVLTSTKH